MHGGNKLVGKVLGVVKPEAWHTQSGDGGWGGFDASIHQFLHLVCERQTGGR